MPGRTPNSRFITRLILSIGIFTIVSCTDDGEKKKPSIEKTERVQYVDNERLDVPVGSSKTLRNKVGKTVKYGRITLADEVMASRSAQSKLVANEQSDGSQKSFLVGAKASNQEIYKELAEYDPFLLSVVENSLPSYNPTLNYEFDNVTDKQLAKDPTQQRFDPCRSWDEDFKREYYFDDNPFGNNFWLMGHVKTYNMSESDLSHHTFGDANGECEEPTYWKTEFTQMADLAYDTKDELSDGTGVLKMGPLTFTTRTASQEYRKVYVDITDEPWIETTSQKGKKSKDVHVKFVEGGINKTIVFYPLYTGSGNYKDQVSSSWQRSEDSEMQDTCYDSTGAYSKTAKYECVDKNTKPGDSKGGWWQDNCVDMRSAGSKVVQTATSWIDSTTGSDTCSSSNDTESFSCVSAFLDSCLDRKKVGTIKVYNDIDDPNNWTAPEKLPLLSQYMRDPNNSNDIVWNPDDADYDANFRLTYGTTATYNPIDSDGNADANYVFVNPANNKFPKNDKDPNYPMDRDDANGYVFQDLYQERTMTCQTKYLFDYRTVSCDQMGKIRTSWDEMKDAILAEQAVIDGNSKNWVKITGGGGKGQGKRIDPDTENASAQHLAPTNPNTMWIPTNEKFIDYDSFLADGKGGVIKKNEKILDQLEQCFINVGETPQVGAEPLDFARIYLTNPGGTEKPNIARSFGSETTIELPIKQYYDVYDSYGRRIRRVVQDVDQTQKLIICTIGEGDNAYVAGGPIQKRLLPKPCAFGTGTCMREVFELTNLQDACLDFCKVQETMSRKCYEDPLAAATDDPDLKPTAEEQNFYAKSMNRHRRAIMSDDPYFNGDDPDGGLLYMSIIGPGGASFNVRVMHNLHKNFMLGPLYNSPLDSVEQGMNSFTFPIPFCPEFGHEYEYAVCNVPKRQHENFGRDPVTGDARDIPNCFDDAAASWNVSNVRIAEKRVPYGSWAKMSKTSRGDLNPPWPLAYQLLKKTTFRVLDPKKRGNVVGNDKFLDEAEVFKTMCIPPVTDDITMLEGSAPICKDSEVSSNICQLGVRNGLRVLKPGSIKFKYYARNGLSTDGEDDELVLVLDTGDDQAHRWHAGWKYYNLKSDPQYGNIITDPEDPNGDINDYQPPTGVGDTMFTPCYGEYAATSTSEQRGCADQDGGCTTTVPDDDDVRVMRTGILHANYSPLVINVSEDRRVNLSGLEAEVSFIGRRYDENINARFGEYTNTYSKAFYNPDNLLYGVYRDVTTRSYVKTGWIDGSQGDALLVLDLNGNGNIDSGFELFGEATVMEKGGDFGSFGNFSAGSWASNGFIALAQYDDNGDFIIDASDAIWERLQLWQDGKDGVANGIVDDGELTYLSASSVTSFNINDIEKTAEKDKYGNETLYRSTYTYDDGGESKEGPVLDVYFVFRELSPAKRNDVDVLTAEEKGNLVRIGADNVLKRVKKD